MRKFDSNQKIGDIVAIFPKAADLFMEYRIDFCCGGNRPLKEAIAESGLNEDEIISRLNELYNEFAGQNENEKDWRKEPLEDLVNHILIRHHAYLWSELPRISELTTKILRVHGKGHPELFNAHKLFHAVKTELEEHLVKEEAFQYPAIRNYEESGGKEDLNEAVEIIKELEDGHSNAGNILKELRSVTNDYTLPDDACATYELTFKKLQELEADVFRHVHLENNILFPRLFELQEKNR